MASSLTKRLDRLERLASELLNQNQGTVYLREGDEVPEGRKPVYVKRVFIDPPEQPQEELPETTEPSPAIERPSPQSFNRPLPDHPLGLSKREAQQSPYGASHSPARLGPL